MRWGSASQEWQTTHSSAPSEEWDCGRSESLLVLIEQEPAPITKDGREKQGFGNLSDDNVRHQ